LYPDRRHKAQKEGIVLTFTINNVIQPNVTVIFGSDYTS